MTTLARLAKVIKGYTPPIGWIERAFAWLATSVKNVLPEVELSDMGKYLHTNDSTGDLEWSDVNAVEKLAFTIRIVDREADVSCDKTYSEIVALINSGKVVIAVIGLQGAIFTTNMISLQNSIIYFTFSYMVDAFHIKFMTLLCDSSNRWVMGESSISD